MDMAFELIPVSGWTCVFGFYQQLYLVYYSLRMCLNATKIHA